MPKHRTRGFLACGLASTFWGCGFFFGKIALREMPVSSMVLYRFLFATAALLPLLVTHWPRFSPREWRTLFFGSLLGIPVQFLVQFHGLALTTVSHASLMVGTLPVLLAVGATVWAHERMDRTGWLALAGSCSGAALIALGRGGSTGASSLRGDLLVVFSMVVSLVWILTNKRLLEQHSAITVSAAGMVLGTVMLAVWVLLRSGPPPVHGISAEAWAALAASGVLCTAATTLLWNYGLTEVPASQAGVLLNMEPLVGSVLGVAVLHESLGPGAWVGGALILGAALVLTTRSRAAAAAGPAEELALP